MTTKDVVAGLGEIGMPILQLVSKPGTAVGYDIDPKLIEPKKLEKYKKLKTCFLHICIPFTKNFDKNVVSLHDKFKPEGIVIHSTISPGTTSRLQKLLAIPVIYSATRGIHKRMLYDLRRYTKFFSVEANAPRSKWASSTYSSLMKKCGVKTKKMTSPLTLELAKIIVDIHHTMDGS